MKINIVFEPATPLTPLEKEPKTPPSVKTNFIQYFAFFSHKFYELHLPLNVNILRIKTTL